MEIQYRLMTHDYVYASYLKDCLDYGQGIILKTDCYVAQTITTMSVGSTCRLHAIRDLNLFPCNSSHGIGVRVNSALKQAVLFAISNLTFYKQ